MQPQPKPLSGALPDIEGAWRVYKQKKITLYPQNALRASSIGDPCERMHYHSIHDWKERELPNYVQQSIFDEGSLHEKDIMRQLAEIGFVVIEQQRSFQMEKPLITGHIDGILLWEGQRIPFDAKSISPHDYVKINSAEDMLHSPKHWHRKYPGQLQIYLLMAEEETGCFILKNKVTGEMKPIWMQVDYDYCEKLLQRAERVYKALKAEVPPERCNDLDVCLKCSFKHICLPDLKMGPGVQAIDDAELAGLLDRRETLAPMAKEFEKIDEQVKEAAKAAGAGEKVCGEYLLRVKEYERTTKVALTWDEKKESYLRTQILKLPTK